MPYHILQDTYEEARLAGHVYGSTKSGIAPFYSDKFSKTGIQVNELFDEDVLQEKVKNICALKNTMFKYLYHQPELVPEELLELLHSYRDMIEPYLADTGAFLTKALKEGKRVLVEGQLLAELCQLSGWGSTDQAQEHITTLFYDFRMLRKAQGPAVSHLEWQAAQRLITEADESLRRKISSQYMDALLAEVRSNGVSADNKPVIVLCRKIISLWIAGDQETVKLMMRRLVNILDDNLEKYTIYRDYGYPVNHHENFQNTKDAPAYIFG